MLSLRLRNESLGAGRVNSVACRVVHLLAACRCAQLLRHYECLLRELVLVLLNGRGIARSQSYRLPPRLLTGLIRSRFSSAIAAAATQQLVHGAVMS